MPINVDRLSKKDQKLLEEEYDLACNELLRYWGFVKQNGRHTAEFIMWFGRYTGLERILEKNRIDERTYNDMFAKILDIYHESAQKKGA